MSGELPLKAHCLPFRQIPHTSRLFLDFLDYKPEVQQFYPRSAKFSEWVQDETGKVCYDSARRDRVAGILERQNKAWGASATTLENISKLRRGAFVAVTGQQVALFGGPAFSLYKALSAVKLAEEARKAGIDCVPVFWLATQDHDLEEVNQVGIPGPDAQFKKISAPTEGVTDAPVSNIKLGPEVDTAVNAVAELLGESDGTTLLRECYRAGETFGSAFGRLFARLFGDWGVILLDASDPELNAIAQPVYASALERSEELNQKLLARGKELESAGYHQQVKVTSSSTLLFCLQDGARVPVHRASSDGFIVGDVKLDKDDLLGRVKASAQDFSANVLLRPVVQDYILPTLAYTGGAAETAYFAQAGVVYEALSGRVTPVIPRFSASILEPKSKALLDKYNLQFTDILQGPEAVREQLASQTLPQDLQGAFEEADRALSGSMAKVRELLGKLDKTLVEAAANAGSKITHQLENLRSRAARAELRQSEVLARHAEMLSNMLYPGKGLQEREVGAIYFIGRYGTQFLGELYQAIHPDCPDHQVITLQ
jgi:bacillithiol biosynthesis cysteine-adding enzyme BshC